MKQRPWPIIILAIAHFLAPIGNLFISSYVNSIGIWENLRDRFQPENLGDTFMFFLIPILSGWLVYLCKKWSYYLYLVLMSYMIISSTYFWYTQMGLISIWPLVFLYFVNVGVVGYFLIPAVRELYFDPRLRWWESKSRYYLEQDVEVISGEKKQSGALKNISETGAFVMMENPPQDESSALMVFENEGIHFEIPITVILHDRMKEIGFGAKFLHTDESLKLTQTLTQKLQKEGKVIENRRPAPEDAFQYWAKRVITFRGGLIPETKKK